MVARKRHNNHKGEVVTTTSVVEVEETTRSRACRGSFASNESSRKADER